MADITEALERLAGLRDRGVLTPKEFDAQKAALLNPPTPGFAPAAPVAPAYYPPRGNRTGLIVGGILVLLIAAGVALWATGVLAKMGIGSTPFGDTSTTMTSTSSPFGTTAAPAANPFGAPAAAPTAVAPAPYAAPTYAAPTVDTAAAGDNPLLGDWLGQGNTSASCPTTMAFGPTTLRMNLMANGVPQVRQATVTYNVQSSALINISTDTGSKLVASVIAGTLYLDGCKFVKSTLN